MVFEKTHCNREDFESGWVVDVAVSGGGMEFFNHSSPPQCYSEPSPVTSLLFIPSEREQESEREREGWRASEREGRHCLRERGSTSKALAWSPEGIYTE